MADTMTGELFIRNLRDRVAREYAIPESLYSEKVKRGLRNADGTGVMAGVTKVGRVIGYAMEDGEVLPIPGRLYYRGINIMDIVRSHADSRTFGYEEVSFLLLMGYLPSRDELAQYNAALSHARTLPGGITEDLILNNPGPNIMNKLAKSVLTLYSYDADPDNTSLDNMLRQCVELIARLPVIVANAYAAKRHFIDGESLYIHFPREDLTTAENFLLMLKPDKSFSPEEARLLDILMMLHAEHGGGNNSAFVCRALASSGTDTYSAIAGAISSLKGPLHGGANAKVREMVQEIRANVDDPCNDDRMRAYLAKILSRQAGDGSGKIYGLGHAVYTLSDPRAELIKGYAEAMAREKDMLKDYEYLRSIERIGSALIMERKHTNSPICANVDLFSGFVLQMLGIPEELITPLFAISRISGWCAHRIEEVVCTDRLMRPAYRNGADVLPYVPMDERN